MLSCYTYNNAQIIEICPTPVKFSGEINFLKKVSSKNVKHFKVIQQHWRSKNYSTNEIITFHKIIAKINIAYVWAFTNIWKCKLSFIHIWKNIYSYRFSDLTASYHNFSK